jgi:hypothetical protein
VQRAIRSAFASYIPAFGDCRTVRRRRAKRWFDEVRGAGLAKHEPELESIIRQSEVSNLRLFDQRVLVDALMASAAGLGDVTAFGRLDKAHATLPGLIQASTCAPCEHSLAPKQFGVPLRATATVPSGRWRRIGIFAGRGSDGFTDHAPIKWKSGLAG